MIKKLQAKLRNKKGFTLVELLIVIAVLGIIAAIAVPRFTGVLSGVKEKSDTRAAELWAKEIEAEFMVDGWTIPDAATGYTIATGTGNNQGFDGEIPKSQTDSTKYLFATIVKDSTGYKVLVYIDSASGTKLLEKTIRGPVK